MGVQFICLGGVSLRVDGTEVRVRGRRERAVLALLIAARRRPVRAESLIEDVWGKEAADSTPGSLQVAISRLRALIEPGRVRGTDPVLLVTMGSAYALLAPACSVDVERFTSLVQQADAAAAVGDPDAALLRCDEAAGLWGGSPFGAEVEGELVRSETARLEDLRLQSTELRVQALLALGRHGMVTGELQALVVAHPLRERLWELLALAQYRSGRQGDALATLRRVRAVLADELGVDPSPGLQQLEADVLDQSSALVPRPTPTPLAPSTPEPFAGTTAAGATSFVGRRTAVAELESTLEGVVTGHGETVLVTGEAGIGKTRLVTELTAVATRHGARVLWGRCHEADYSPAYWPWLPLLRELGPMRPGSLVTALLSPTDTPPGADAATAELRTFDAVAALLAERAAETPLLLVIEDVQWADPSSLRLLTFVAGSLAGKRVMIVTTLRQTVAPTPALETHLGALGRLQTRRISLDGLAPAHVRRLIVALSGVEPDDELASAVAQRTDGNPFFIIELVRLLAAEHRLHGVGARDVPVPNGVQDVLRLRLAGLSPTTGRLLRMAAVVGREFDLDLISEVSGTDLDEVIDALDEAVRTHHVEEGAKPGRYRFTHALVRETLVGSVSLARRGRLHADIARALELRLGHDPELVNALAHHFVLGAAIRPELADPAVQYAMAAARLAESRGALDEALVHWEQALTGDASAPVPALRRRFDVLLGLGRARHRRGEVSGSRRALESAVEIGRELEDVALVAEAATSFRGAGVWRWREVGAGDPAMVAVLREAADSLPPGTLLARVLASLSMELTEKWCSAEAATISERAVQMSRVIGDADLFADVAAMHMLILWGRPGASGERLALAAEVLRHPLSQEQELYARFGAATAHLHRGEPDAADREITRCTELARRLRHTGADVPLAWWRFCRAVDSGDTQLTSTLADQVIERHSRSQVVALPEGVPLAEIRRAGAGSTVPESTIALATGNPNPAFRALVAHALTETGRSSEAVDLLGDPIPDGAWNYSSTYGDCLRVDVLATAGPSARLRQALDRIEPWGHEFATYGSTDDIGSIEYFIGRGKEGLGDLDGARAAYAHAVDRNRTVRVMPWLLRAQQRVATLPIGPA